MVKIIKKIGRSVLILVSVLIIASALTVLISGAPKFQTFAVRQAADRISEKLGIKITVGDVSYTFFRKLVLYNVVVEDHNRDTMLTVRQLSLRVREFNPGSSVYRFGRTDLYEPDFRMITDTAGILNLTRLTDSLKGGGTADTTKKLDVTFSQIDVIDGSYSLVSKSDTEGIRNGTINWKNMNIRSLNGSISDLQINPDSVAMDLNGISFTESGGFNGKRLEMAMSVRDEGLFFRDISLTTDSSIIAADHIFLVKKDSTGFSDFISKVRLDIILQESVLNTCDLGYFAKPFEGTADRVRIHGKVTGSVSEMKGRDIGIDYATDTRMKFDFDISGLPEIDDSYLYLDFREMSTSAEEIEMFTLPGGKKINLPPVIHDMGLLSFSGSFTGFTTDFVTFGTLSTAHGTFSTDLSLRPDGKEMFRFRGLLRADEVDLRYFADNNELLGGLWLHADIDGSMRSFSHLSASISGTVDSVEINRYMYRNVGVEGTYTDRVWDGNVSVRDRNINMDILGRFDLRNDLPEFDFTMNLTGADLHKLNLISRDTIFRASALLTANFRGNNIDNLDGDLRLINSTLENSFGKISIYDFLIHSEKEQGVPLLSLKSDFADIELRGDHTFGALGQSVKKVLAGLFPSKFAMPSPSQKVARVPNKFSFNARFRKIDKLNEFLGTGLAIADGTIITGYFMDDRQEAVIEADSRAIKVPGGSFTGLSLHSEVKNGIFNLEMESDTLRMPDGSELNNLKVISGSRPDTLSLSVTWDNKNNIASGEIKALGTFSKSSNGYPVFTTEILPSDLTVMGKVWNISRASVVRDSLSTSFNNLLVSSGENYLQLNGKISHESRDRLTLRFKGLDLTYLNKRKRKDPSSARLLTVSGITEGNVTLSDAYNDPLVESDIRITDLVMNNNQYGLVTVRSGWNQQQKIAVIEIKNDYHGARFFDIEGTYNPATRIADINASADRMPLNVINPLVSSFASDIRGLGSGRINIQGRLNKLIMKGALMAEDASLKVDFLQTRYSFSDSIRFNAKGIEFKNIRIFDEKKNQGTITGGVYHNSFKDMAVNFDITFNKMLVLNTKPKDNDIFYGTAYGTGYAGIKGNGEKLSFNISGKTEDNTQFFIPLTSSESVNEYPYIIMMNPGKKTDSIAGRELFVKKEDESIIELNFDLEITPVAEVQLLIDSKAGDVIKGTGSGKLNIRMDAKGDLKMAGTYVIDDGDYLFTLGNIINKKFSIQQGGTITWNGGIDEADLDIKAIYKTKASLYELYPVDEKLKERIPVECQLNLSEKLMNPVIGFNINLPTADEEARQYLNSAINTEEELSRQFLYLLVMNSFLPDPNLSSTSAITAPQGASAIGVTTTEMLSNQVANWLSQISNDFDIGLNYRPGSGITPQEMEVALSTQLLNDKVVVNGNLDMNGKNATTKASTISGDFNIEFKLTEKLRFKVFNRSNNDIFYETAPYTQGLGIFYRRDFDRLKDVFIVPDNRRKKKTGAEEEPPKQ